MAKLNRTYRLICGIVVLLVVDVIWVGSSEMTKFIFKEEDYDKPFFTTYAKTAMFTLYLLGFLFWKPWREQCCSSKPSYTLVDCQDDILEEDCEYVDAEPLLSESTWVPIKYDKNGERSSGNESDGPTRRNSTKSVHFSRVTEVRHLSESQADDALLARLSYSASLRAQENAMKAANKLPVIEVAKVALLFCFMWFIGNVSYQEALSNTEAGIVNLLSSSSGLFTLLMASAFPANSGDHFTVSKLCAILVSIAGVAVVSFADQNEYRFTTGVVWTLVGAFFYAAYIVFLRRKIKDDESMDFPMFFGFVGLFNLLLLWPGIVLLHFTRLEAFQWPSLQQCLYIVCNGLIGTVLSELMWLWGCFLTSSLIATLSLSLTIPFTILFDVIFKKVEYSLQFFIGTIPMFLSFFAVSLLSHYDNWDPVSLAFRRLFKLCRRKPKLYSIDKEQTESLIDVNGD